MLEIPAADAEKALKIAAANGLTCAMYTPSFFADKIFKDGAMTSNDPAIRAKGLANAKLAVDTTHVLGAKTMVFWNGREGFDFVLAKEWPGFIQAVGGRIQCGGAVLEGEIRH